MSITFLCPGAPNIPNPMFGVDSYEPPEISSLPEINIGNFNATATFEILGLVYESYGTIPVAGLERLIVRGLAVLGNPVERAAFIEPASVNGQSVPPEVSLAAAIHEQRTSRSKGATVVFMGCTDEAIQRNVGLLVNLFREALEGGHEVCWG